MFASTGQYYLCIFVISYPSNQRYCYCVIKVLEKLFIWLCVGVCGVCVWGCVGVVCVCVCVSGGVCVCVCVGGCKYRHWRALTKGIYTRSIQ